VAILLHQLLQGVAGIGVIIDGTIVEFEPDAEVEELVAEFVDQEGVLRPQPAHNLGNDQATNGAAGRPKACGWPCG